jgi:hypothetical protein
MKTRLVEKTLNLKGIVKVYGIAEGPIYSDDYEGWDEELEGEGWVVVALIEDVNGSIFEEEIIFETFDDAYELVSWFKKQVAPYTVEIF